MYKLAIKYDSYEKFNKLLEILYSKGYFLTERGSEDLEDGEKLTLSEFKEMVKEVGNDIPDYFNDGIIALTNEDEEIYFFSKDFIEEKDQKYYKSIVQELIDNKKVYDYDENWQSELTKKITISFNKPKNHGTN